MMDRAHVVADLSPWTILKVEVTVMHLSTVNISQTVNDKDSITTAITYEVAYELSISAFRFDLRSF